MRFYLDDDSAAPLLARLLGKAGHDVELPVMKAQGHHPGILVVRRDNNPLRDLTPRGIVAAIGDFTLANVPLIDQFVILNHWR